MNKRQLAIVRNDSMRLLDPMQRRPRGCVRINIGNEKSREEHFKHELAKFKACWELACEGKEFVTEAVFVNGKRADIFVLDDCEVIEVLHSETKEMAEKKCADYPVKKVIFIDSRGD